MLHRHYKADHSLILIRCNQRPATDVSTVLSIALLKVLFQHLLKAVFKLDFTDFNLFTASTNIRSICIHAKWICINEGLTLLHHYMVLSIGTRKDTHTYFFLVHWHIFLLYKHAYITHHRKRNSLKVSHLSTMYFLSPFSRTYAVYNTHGCTKNSQGLSCFAQIMIKHWHFI